MRFPLDPNSPRTDQEQEKKVERRWKGIERMVLLLSLALSIMGIILAIRSLEVSEVSYRASVAQYIEGSRSADVQFDTIAKILQDQRRINRDILAITASQLKGSEELLAQVAALNTPDLILRKASFTTRETDERDNFKTFVSVQVDNTGRRSVLLLEAEAFVVLKGKVVGANRISSLAHYLNSDYLLSFRFNITASGNPIFVFVFRYRDLYSNKVFTKQVYYRQAYLDSDQDGYSFGSFQHRDISVPLALNDICTAEEIIGARMAVKSFKSVNGNFTFYSDKSTFWW